MVESKYGHLIKKFSFYMASMGTAFGLGNLWRFPYTVADYGGGAFVFLYILLAIFIGIPLVISEVILGKYLIKEGISINTMINRMKAPMLLKKAFKVMSWLPVLVAFGVLTYYSVLSGWSLHLIMRSFSSFALDQPLRGELSFLGLKQNGLLQILLLSVHLILVYLICTRGAQYGVNRWLSFVLPVFFIFLIFIGLKILTPQDLFVAAKYMIYPNFHMLTLESFSYVLGHVLFTMSLGFSIYISFSVFLPQDQASANSSSKVALIDTIVSLFIGFIIFPVIIVSGYSGRMSEALFRAIPNFIEFKGLSPLVAFVFYLCVFIAAVNASLGLVEGMLYRTEKYFKQSRVKILSILTLASLFAGSLVVFCNKRFSVKGGIIESLDDILINFILPFSALFFTILTLTCVKRSFVEREFDVDAAQENRTIYLTWRFFVTYILPVFMVLSISLRLFN
jgi:NSS family neurotransmitter:Na+ symporter